MGQGEEDKEISTPLEIQTNSKSKLTLKVLLTYYTVSPTKLPRDAWGGAPKTLKIRENSQGSACVEVNKLHMQHYIYRSKADINHLYPR